MMKATLVEYYLEDEIGEEIRITGCRLTESVMVTTQGGKALAILSAYDVDKVTEAMDNAAAFAVVR